MLCHRVRTKRSKYSVPSSFIKTYDLAISKSKFLYVHWDYKPNGRYPSIRQSTTWALHITEDNGLSFNRFFLFPWHIIWNIRIYIGAVLMVLFGFHKKKNSDFLVGLTIISRILIFLYQEVFQG